VENASLPLAAAADKTRARIGTDVGGTPAQEQCGFYGQVLCIFFRMYGVDEAAAPMAVWVAN